VPRTTELDRVKTWRERVRSSCKLYDKWAERFETERLEDYYLGRQWKGLQEDVAKKRYVINLVFSSIEVNKPALSFYRPQVRVQTRPGRADDLDSHAKLRAQLSEDTIQTFIDDPDIDFHLETTLALHEAHFRFGVVEVGYTADYTDNPNAGKPVLKENEDTVVKDSEGNAVTHGDRIVNHEQLFVKHIPADTFRVALSSRNKVARNDWAGYYEWHYVEDIKANKAYSNTAGLKPTGVVSKELRDDDDLEARSHADMVKLWKIWDIRQGVRHVIADGHDKFLIEGRKFSFLPFAVVKFHEILKSFYPFPPVYAWLGPQDEVNETREMQRAHRRRFYRRYTVDPNVDDQELQKLEDGGDGVYAKILQSQAPVPVPDAPLSSDVWQHLDASKNDFMTVSAIGGDQRGVAESETATQASIIDVRSRLRETSARTKVADWMADIARLILLTIRENMALPFWISANVDPASANKGQESAKITAEWKQIMAEDLGKLDLDVFIELASMSPVTEDVQRNSWNQVLAILTNPQILMILAQSETLLRKTLSLYGIRSEDEITEIQKVAQATIQAMQAQAAADTAAKAKLPGSSGELSAAAASQIQGGNGNGAAPPGPPGSAEMMSLLSSVGRQQ